MPLSVTNIQRKACLSTKKQQLCVVGNTIACAQKRCLMQVNANQPGIAKQQAV
jgi:hypothetical protein